MKKERNYYLIGLFIFGALFISGLLYMLKIAFSNPVEMDSSHMMAYRDLDKNYNQIAESGRKFDESYAVSLEKVSLRKDMPANLELNITDKTTGKMVDANITALITRPDTSKHDIKITDFNKTSVGSYLSKPFSVALEGRWKVMYKIEIGEVQKFIDFETFANKAAK